MLDWINQLYGRLDIAYAMAKDKGLDLVEQDYITLIKNGYWFPDEITFKDVDKIFNEVSNND